MSVRGRSGFEDNLDRRLEGREEVEKPSEVTEENTISEQDFIALQQKTKEAALQVFNRVKWVFQSQGMESQKEKVEKVMDEVAQKFAYTKSLAAGLKGGGPSTLLTKLKSLVFGLEESIIKEAEVYKALKKEMVRAIAKTIDEAFSSIKVKEFDRAFDLRKVHSEFDKRLIQVLRVKNNRNRMKQLEKEVSRQLVAASGELAAQAASKKQTLKADHHMVVNGISHKFKETAVRLKAFKSARHLEPPIVKSKREELASIERDIKAQKAGLKKTLKDIDKQIEKMHEDDKGGEDILALMVTRTRIEEARNMKIDREEAVFQRKKVRFEKDIEALKRKSDSMRTSEQLQSEGYTSYATMNAWRSEVRSEDGKTLISLRRAGAVCDGSDLTKGAQEIQEEIDKLSEQVDSLREQVEMPSKNQKKRTGMTLELQKKEKQLEELKAKKSARHQVLLHQASSLIMDALKQKEEAFKKAQENPDADFSFKNGKFSYVQMGLVNEDKAGKINKNAREERAMMMDQAYIFQFLNGKNVIFDGKGFIDDKGVIHAPYKISKGKQCVKLQSYITHYNFSTQGHSKNTGAQKEINDRAWKKTQEKANLYMCWMRDNQASLTEQTKFIGDYNSLKERYGRGESNETMAAEMVEFEQMMDACITVNCMSGKDRTGDLVNILKARTITKEIANREETRLAHTSAKVTKEFRRNIHIRMAQKMMKKGTSLKVAKLNTGIAAFKLSKMIWGMDGLTFRERVRMGYLARYIKS